MTSFSGPICLLRFDISSPILRNSITITAITTPVITIAMVINDFQSGILCHVYLLLKGETVSWAY